MSKKQRLISTLRDKDVKNFEFDEMFGKQRIKFYTIEEDGTTFFNTEDVLSNDEVELIRQFAIQATLQLLEGHHTREQQPTVNQLVADRMKHINLLGSE